MRWYGHRDKHLEKGPAYNRVKKLIRDVINGKIHASRPELNLCYARQVTPMPIRTRYKWSFLKKTLLTTEVHATGHPSTCDVFIFILFGTSKESKSASPSRNPSPFGRHSLLIYQVCAMNGVKSIPRNHKQSYYTVGIFDGIHCTITQRR